MRINTNLSALNAYRNLNMTDSRLNKSLERLSSGLRINRAADDAAGLAISEKMRGQIRGLNQAARNAQDGISLMQTAEGALNETHSILQRMRELSVQAANDTLTSSDRIEIQKEIEQLTSEIDRIASTTEFNTKKLLDGSSSALTSTSDLNTRIFMRDGLRTVDQFGQKSVGGGNYRLDIESNPGLAQVQKTDIMKIKHAGDDVVAEVDHESDLGPYDSPIAGPDLPNHVQRINVQNVIGGDFKLTFYELEKYELDLGGAQGGSFVLSAGDDEVTLQHDATAGDIQNALAGILDGGEVVVEELDDNFGISFFDFGREIDLYLDDAGLTGVTGTASLSGNVTTPKEYSNFVNLFAAPGVDYGSSGTLVDQSGITFINTNVATGGEGQIGIVAYGGFNWSNVDTNPTAEIIIREVSGDLQVSIDVTDGDGDRFTATDTMQIRNGYYDYDAHGLKFKFDTDALAAFSSGGEITIDLQEAFGTSGTLNILTESSNAIAMENAWNVNDTDTNSLSTAEFRSTAGGISDGIEVTADDLPEGAYTLKIEGTNLDDNSAEIKVIIETDGGTVLKEDEYYNTSSNGFEDETFTYDNHGITFALFVGDAQTLEFEQNIPYTGGDPTTYGFASHTSGTISYDASASEVRVVLENLSEISSGDVLVTKVDDGVWDVEFIGKLGEQRLNLLGIDDSGLVGEAGVGDLAGENTTLYDIDRFWDASGNFLVQDPQTINLVQGDGKKTSITIFGSDTISDVAEKLNRAIHEDLGQSNFNDTEDAYVSYVTDSNVDEGFFSVNGTFIIQSAITGKDGEIRFSGNEGIINALSLTTLQDSEENVFNITVANAHDPSEVIAEDMRIVGNMLVGVVHENVDVKFDPMAAVELDIDATGSFTWESGDQESVFVHLSDNTMVFHIGANPLQDVAAAIGDMRAEALGVDNILVNDRNSANRAISQIDYAIERVSGERAKLGAVQNRLEHTINNLNVAAENLAAAESRVRDLDFAMEMVEFTRNQIMAQAGTSMLAQANQKPQSVLMLLQ